MDRGDDVFFYQELSRCETRKFFLENSLSINIEMDCLNSGTFAFSKAKVPFFEKAKHTFCFLNKIKWMNCFSFINEFRTLPL